MMTQETNTTDLVKHLKKASRAYYNGEPIMSDADFDALRDKLVEIDPDHPFLSETGSPISEIGWPEHTHRTFMGSLAKIAPNRTNPAEMLQEFGKWCEGKGTEFYLSEKYDGSTVVATYENSKLVTLATRGDGVKGENITPNAQFLKNLPLQLSKPFSGEIRGEAMLRISIFDKYFRPLGYSNPRNAANGKVRDTKEDPLKEYVEIMWFDILPTDRDLNSEKAKWDLLSDLGLCAGSREKIDAHLAWAFYQNYCMPDDSGQTTRSILDYEIDGLVLKVNDLDLQESLGVSSNKPKGAIALKFPSSEAETTVIDIKWNRGLTGVICPTAHFEPVSIGGVNISKASLCGIEEIKRLDVNIGDRVLISRRNDVIPKVERVVSRQENRPAHQAPTHCELCGDLLVIEGAYISCLNLECQGETYGNLMTWIREFQIKGFGPSMIRGLIGEGVTNVAQMYEATEELFNRAAGSEKNGARRYEVIRNSREVRLSTFLSALNIRALGTTNGQRLEKQFGTLENILNASVETLQEVPGIKTNAQKISAGLQEKAELIQRLNVLLKIKGLDNSGPLAGKSFCITGDLSIPRPQVHDWIKEQGGEVKTSVSKELNFLVTDDPSSGTSKNKKADQYGVKKITEEDLYTIAGSRPQ